MQEQAARWQHIIPSVQDEQNESVIATSFGSGCFFKVSSVLERIKCWVCRVISALISSDHLFFHAVIGFGVSGKSKGPGFAVETIVMVLPHIPSGQD